MGNCIESLFNRKENKNNQSLLDGNFLAVCFQTQNNQNFSLFSKISEVEEYLFSLKDQKNEKEESKIYDNQKLLKELKQCNQNSQKLFSDLKLIASKIKTKFHDNQQKKGMIRIEIQQIVVLEVVDKITIECTGQKKVLHLQVFNSEKKKKDQNYCFKKTINRLIEIFVCFHSTITISIKNYKVTLLISDLARQILVADVLTFRNKHFIFGHLSFRAQFYDQNYEKKMEKVNRIHLELEKELELSLRGEIKFDQLSSYKYESQSRSSYISYS